jgi:beta-galactosidase
MTESPAKTSRLHLGAAFYPEHWPQERWPEDIRLMKEAGLTVVRMGEFAWSTLETSPDRFNFMWLEIAIEELALSGIQTVLGTPTAAPPAWLIQMHPDILAVDEHGQRVQFGNRCHYCVTSPEFHEATRRIVYEMGMRFGRNANVIGWQLDNEYNRVCYCDRCRTQFQQFLEARYGSLDALNKAWSTAYWSQTYSSWDQIPIPIGPHNPGLMLEHKRFVTECYRKFQAIQLEELRPHLKEGVWVSHNFMGWYDGYDSYEIAADLDLVTWDWYIGSGHNDHLDTGAIHDLTRGFKRRNFWVMETQPGSVNWSPLNNMLDKGEARAMAWEAIAHGSDGILYWQWRSALGGQEQYHGTLVDQSGQPRPFYSEVQQLGKDIAAASDLLAGTTRKARVAMLYDYESRWSIQWQRHNKDFDYVKHFLHYYRPIAARNVQIDILNAKTLTDASQLSAYRMVIAPALVIIDEPLAEALRGYIKRGGHLVLTARSGMKNRNNALQAERQPAFLKDLAGIEVEEYYALDEPVPVKGNWFEGQSEIWAERLKVANPTFTPSIAKYGKANGWLDNQSGITVNGTGSGLVYYVGMYLDDEAQDALLDRFLRNSGIGTPVPAPSGVEIQARVDEAGQNIYIVINHFPAPASFDLPWPATEHLGGQKISKTLKLDPYGVAIITEIKAG